MEAAPPAGSTGDIVSTPDARRCGTCGAPLRFDPSTADLRCRHCRGTAAIGAVDDPTFELDYAATIGAVPGTSDVVDPVRLQCADCGAPADYAPNTLAASCPYCRVPFVGAPWSTRTIAPTGIVALAITEEHARANTRTWLGNRWFAPRHLDKVATDALRSGYTPAWVFSMSTVAAYRGRRGDDYLDTETYTTTDANGNSSTQTRTVTKVRWRSASGTVELRFRDVTAFAGTDPLSRFGEDLEPWGVDDTVPYQDDFLRGSTAQVYTKPPAAGLERARERTTGAVEDAIRADIGGDHQEIGDVDRRDLDIGLRYVLLPGWEATYRHRDETYQLAVNGRTGAVDGTRPYSKVKIAVAVAVALAVFALAVFLIVRASSNPPPTTPTSTTVVTVSPTTAPRPPPSVTVSIPELPSSVPPELIGPTTPEPTQPAGAAGAGP